MELVAVVVVMQHGSIISGMITGGDPHGVWVQPEGSLPVRLKFIEIRSMTVL